MGFFTQILVGLQSGQPVGLFAPQEPLPPVIPTASKILNLYSITGCNAIAGVPTFVEVSVVHWLFT
jgi:hypothetical protein